MKQSNIFLSFVQPSNVWTGVLSLFLLDLRQLLASSPKCSIMVGMHLSEPFPELCLNVESGRCLMFRVSKTVTVNQDTDHHLWTYVLVLIVTGIVNLTSAIIIWRKETTGINKMIICDCLFNMANMAVYSTNMSSWRLLGSSELCTSWLFFLMVRIK